ncbi:pentapeptide repeat-containing protein [Pseudanabaena sp. FACHB-1998]|uniref:pentapeptide repeat-containing protein n=1 Tax=Pseudanabaena sp. FACHB-1998 TaxID=2692858 RepID=UPI0016803E6E|nr:pentapeptide repeat-containing protein [Pseudanabaena sp. FACHB-1998]MBD2178376.1 pentapeptide repeat-containing protein [Pseudanabaena sp. FACHB-1998]
MAKSFVNQNLSDRSFRGQDLTDADFTGANLRGCDFRDAILEGANFTAVITGKSRKQLVNLTIIVVFIVGLVTVAFAFVVLGIIAFMAGDTSTFVFVFPSAIVIAIVSILASMITQEVALSSVVVGTFVFAVIAIITIIYQTFLRGDIASVIGWSFICYILLLYSFSVISSMVNSISEDIGTHFEGANLTRTKFVYSKLRETSFFNAICDYVDWQGSELHHCDFSTSITNGVVNFYANRKLGRNKDFKNINFERGCLVGADLVDANLYNANLNNTDLRYATLINTNLSKVKALGADFSGANLTGACIENWGINADTNFDRVTCDYIFLKMKSDENIWEQDLKQEVTMAWGDRKPPSGFFQEGDFAKLIRQYLDTLDLLFRDGDDPKAFTFALQKLLSEYEDAQIQFGSLQNLGDGDIVLRLVVGGQQVPKSRLYSFFTQTKKLAQSFFSKGENQNFKQLESEIKRLKQTLSDKDRQISTLEVSRANTKKTSSQDAKVGNNFSLISVIVQDSMFGNKKTDINAGGDVSGVAVGNISGVAGKDQKGIAGRDINGQVTVTIQQLHNSDAPEAPQLVELLTQLQTTIAKSPDLSDKDKQKALKYLDNIGEIANKKDGDLHRIDELIDNILGVVSKAAKLLTPVQAIADSLRKLLQL